jgi:hypothetical protein
MSKSPIPQELNPETFVVSVHPGLEMRTKGNEVLPSGSFTGATVWKTSYNGLKTDQQGRPYTFPLSGVRSFASAEQTRVSVVEISPTGESRLLPLPEKLERGLLRFLREGTPFDSDCISFAMGLAEVSYTYGKFNYSTWRITPCESDRSLSVGQVVAVGKSERALTHFGMVLGVGSDGQPLIIQKLGSNSFVDGLPNFTPVVVTSLPQMKQLYSSPEAYVVRQ